ncbi:hypothetical protein SBC1_58400 (plasmid) [Caballeronia sp. SBC1]|uniref:hypothetical protein n=1 Tax=unclassified Caballeronia TaxID=2646786 RepID=UPI0013E0F908|nr:MULTISPECIES: hypothetical protein [unclassified Caballeronia]QIE27729.1 hypothetical protein SBC2_58040 [Caballeronia sp. SBC2]QIN65794.1 hypothetical protein SBC1_58400 [Caballeronia sp. SBC1]
MKSYQAQRVEARDTIRSGDTPYESPVRRESQEARAQADQDVYGDSLDIPLNHGGMMDAVRDAVRANL